MNYTVYYNKQIIENAHMRHFDLFTSRFLPYTAETFSPYGFFVQKAIERQFMRANNTYSLGAIGASQSSFMSACNEFQFKFVFGIPTAGVFTQLVISDVRTNYYQMLKKLGVHDFLFWTVVLLCITVLVMFSFVLQIVVAYLFDVQPFTDFDVGTWFFTSFLGALDQAVVCYFSTSKSS